MNNEILNLQPERVFYFFNEICNIPRPSGKEDKVVAWLLDLAKQWNLEAKRDERGNVLISKPATAGKENVTPLILQSHVDMVCEKNATTKFDFTKDSIQPYVDNGWIKAKGTTLGADDGIGVAITLALLESKEIEHGPLEALFTVDEEMGMTGAFALQPNFMKGKMLLNLDSEDEGEFFIGCAGGKDTTAMIDCDYEKVPSKSIAYTITVNGLKGGHSGDDINKGLGNAVKILNRLLWNAYQDFDMRIADIKAGNLRNAIAREGFAVVTIPESEKKGFENYVTAFNQTMKNEFHQTDPDVNVSFEPAKMPTKILEEGIQIDLMNSLYVCPHGVFAMSQDIENLVETSSNLASVKIENDRIIICTSQRSSVESKKQAAVERVSTTFYMIGAEVVNSDGYPGWEPNPDSNALKALVTAYQNVFHKEPKVKAIHAGLECGLFSQKYPGLDMVSFGPTLRGVHSPDEKLEIATVKMCWDLTLEFLRILK
jgi:dipeptidase D